MAQLPPKIPNMSPNWANFGHQKSTSMPTAAAFLSTSGATTTTMQQASWVDEFFDFSSAKRGAHRRSASDGSVAFLETAGDGGRQVMMTTSTEFERLDDHQLMSMFGADDGMTVTAQEQHNASSTSDNNNNNNSNSEEEERKQQHREEVKNEAEEVQSKVPPPPPPLEANNSVDPKRVKRILANRQSAQRSRVRKLQYISELERSVTYLQTEVSALSPRVAFLDHQRSVLSVGNSALRQRIAALAQDKIFKDAHQEELRKEIERLNQVYHQQNVKKMDTNAGDGMSAADNENELVMISS